MARLRAMPHLGAMQRLGATAHPGAIPHLGATAHPGAIPHLGATAHPGAAARPEAAPHSLAPRSRHKKYIYAFIRFAIRRCVGQHLAGVRRHG
ncbi:hypothetical protein GCM10010167_39440 [Paractinoplanes deccanensis]